MKVWKCEHIYNIDCVEVKVDTEVFKTEKSAKEWVAEQLRLDKLNWPYDDGTDYFEVDSNELSYQAYVDLGEFIECSAVEVELKD